MPIVDFKQLEKKLNICFKDKNLLTQAFIHRSYLNENSALKMGHNERLEFLGDAVLELIVTDHLYKEFPNAPEGELTAYRSSLVNTIVIGTVAQELGMNEYLLLSKGESKDIGKARMHILANTFESFIGALYIDSGYGECVSFVNTFLFPKLTEILKKKLWRDAKSLVQEKAQEIYHVTPSYKVLSESGPDHDKKFTVGIYFGAELIEQGKGKSKQEAEQLAARAAVEAKKWLD
jgi:ribonuclease-3